MSVFKVYYNIGQDSIAYEDAVSVQDLSIVKELLEKLRPDNVIYIYNFDLKVRTAIRGDSAIDSYNIEISGGDEGLFKNVNKLEVNRILDKFADVLQFPQKFGFTEEQAPW